MWAIWEMRGWGGEGTRLRLILECFLYVGQERLGRDNRGHVSCEQRILMPHASAPPAPSLAPPTAAPASRVATAS